MYMTGDHDGCIACLLRRIGYEIVCCNQVGSGLSEGYTKLSTPDQVELTDLRFIDRF